ncbi:MAG: nicotinate-nucleotide adenylyltransferase [Planctomycetota bacterium]|jgi:nicotinate-nucleotide adenylyltransferase
MKTYGILGGTFDPIHNGHISLAENTLKALSFNKILMIPALSPPHKNRPDITAPRHRLKMLELALQDAVNIEVSKLELNRSGKSYTIDTLKELYRNYPAVNFRLIFGTDMLGELHLWKDIEEVIKLGNPVIAVRPGSLCSRSDLESAIDTSIHGFIEQLAENILELPPVPVSSTELRKRLYSHEDPKKLPLPAATADYIIKHELYR